MNIDFYVENSYKTSKLITKKYSTSFSLATSLLEKEKKRAIYAVYAFVRLADEIVDSMHGYDKAFLLKNLDENLQYALDHGISTNTILMSFADTVKKYNISREHIKAFMDSMKCDLIKNSYTTTTDLENYIYGSADVVGLMCLKVFCNGQWELYNKLEGPAQKLGSAFQKVNFLRDIKDDINELGRSYFPEISENGFNEQSKKQIQLSIKKDFDEAWKGIKQLPGRSRLATALAYFYYYSLFEKIMATSPNKLMKKRVRILNFRKILILFKVSFLYKTRFI